jgi:hypothetical protein
MSAFFASATPGHNSGDQHMRILTTLLAAGLALSSTSSFAASKTERQKQQDTTATASAPIKSSEQKYCVDQSPDEASGTRIYTHECHTKAEWAKLGVDIDAEQKQQ